jgi:multiple sugar transport system substrate-binding protein
MDKKRVFWPMLAVVVALSLILSACAPAATPTPEKVVVTSVVTSVVEKQATVVVTATPVPLYTGPKTRVNLWHTIPTETETFFVGELMPKFSAMHPECNVVIRNMGTEDPAIVRAGLAAGGASKPDMWWIASSETGSYVEADVLADVDGWLAQHPDIKDNIIPSLLDLSSYQGKVRSLPWMTNDTAMWINVDAFEKAGVPVPSQDPEKTWTWQEFADAVEKVSTPDMKGYLVSVGGPVWDFWVFHSWYAAAGGDASKIPVLDSPAAIKAVTFLSGLVDGGYTVFSEPNKGWDAGPWYAGKAAIMTNGPWNFPTLSTFEDFKFTVVPFPRDVKPATNLGGDQLFIAKNEDPKVEACSFAFAEYMLSDEFQIAFQIQSGNLPVTKSAAASKEYQDHLQKYPFMAGFVNQVPYGVARQPIPTYSEIANVFGLAWDDVMLNKKPVEERFKAAQTEAAKFLE